MRIAWFTPFSKKSAIGKYSKSFTSMLANYCEVDLWLSEEDDLWDTDLNIVNYSAEDDSIFDPLEQYDLCIYNLGNCFPFHKDIYEVSKKVKGIVILHDFVMHHFFVGYFLNYKKDPEKYLDCLKYHYDFEVNEIEELYSKDGIPVWETYDVINYPFYEEAISGAFGVITHSNFLRKG